MPDREESVHLWGSLSSCAPVGNRRSRRVANPPQAASLPHMKRSRLASEVHAQKRATPLSSAGRPGRGRRWNRDFTRAQKRVERGEFLALELFPLGERLRELLAGVVIRLLHGLSGSKVALLDGVHEG